MILERITFQRHEDLRGQLVVAEEDKEIPFPVRRIYYLYGTKRGLRRGFHAHKKLQQVLICLSGSCKLHLDDGKDIAEVLLDKPYEGIYISSCIWREMYDFSNDAVLLVLASEKYDESDYIRDYKEFIKYVRKN